MTGGMGLTAFTWSEVKAFTDSSRFKLSEWEAEQMILMSRAYVDVSVKAKEYMFPPPYTLYANSDEAIAIQRSLIEEKFRAMRGKRKG